MLSGGLIAAGVGCLILAGVLAPFTFGFGSVGFGIMAFGLINGGISAGVYTYQNGQFTTVRSADQAAGLGEIDGTWEGIAHFFGEL